MLTLNVADHVSVKVSTAAPPWRLAKLLKVTLLVPPLSVYAPLVPVMADQPLAFAVPVRVPFLARLLPPPRSTLFPYTTLFRSTLVPAVPMAALPRPVIDTPPTSPAIE